MSNADELTPAEKQSARLLAAGNAHDADDLAHLLDVLGLHREAGTQDPQDRETRT
ncbi:hypothetical protein [Nocardiopsis rhodophaea]|uniref:hypothetical protein n=1 Tax=Nocardiopsis rhodophaea TaxID=280238 RepID=UPI0031D93244